MPPINATQTLYLHELVQRIQTAQHGSKGMLMQTASQALGVAPSTVSRWLAEHMGRSTGRKRRCDAGERDVSDEELKVLSAALYGTFRKTGRRIMTFDSAVGMLRANGMLSSGLSTSRLGTILMERGLHPTQLTRPEPSIEQRSKHPNHVWQVDASVCVAYYLSNATGLQVMDATKFYKNKPANTTRIQDERLIRYTVADHCSHEILTQYYLGSESAANLTEFLIWCFAPKPGHVFHGVPFIVQMDMGSANTSAPTLNLLERMQVRVIVHERHNSRANGSVEKAHHLWEVGFESSLRFARVADLADLNAKALMWSHNFCATKVHTRHGMTRHDCWLLISADQLRIAPPIDVMRAAVTTKPETRRVSNDLEVTFAVRGHGVQTFDVRHVPGVMAGAKLLAAVNLFRMPALDVAYNDDATGEQCWMTLEPLKYGADGWREEAPVIGEEIRSHHRGLLDHNRDAVLLRAYGGTDAKEAANAQEKGALVFGGAVNPWAATEQAELPSYMRKRGTELDVQRRVVTPTLLTVIEACKRLRAELRDAYTPAVYGWVSARFADGVPEDQIDGICAQFMGNRAQATDQPAERMALTGTDSSIPAGLRIVAGNS